MTTAINYLWSIAVALVATAPAWGNGQESTVSFSDQVVPLLQQRCSSCHMTGQEAGAMRLIPGRAYDSLVGVPAADGADLVRVKPGHPEDSYLYRKLKGSHYDVGGQGGRMPLGMPSLRQPQLQLIHDWIEQGAQNN